MKLEKTGFFVLLLICSATIASAQVTTVKRYNPSGTSTPQTYSTETQESASDAATRRAKALSKVQGTPAPSASKSMTAKGGPAPNPVQYRGSGSG